MLIFQGILAPRVFFGFFERDLFGMSKMNVLTNVPIKS